MRTVVHAVLLIVMVMVCAGGTSLGLELYLQHLKRQHPQETTVRQLAQEFAAKFDQAGRGGNGGVLCLRFDHVAGPVRLPRDCPVGTWTWIRAGQPL